MWPIRGRIYLRCCILDFPTKFKHMIALTNEIQIVGTIFAQTKCLHLQSFLAWRVPHWKEPNQWYSITGPNQWYSITIGYPLYGMKRKAFLPMWDSGPNQWYSITIGHPQEGFPSNMGISKPKMTTNANTWSRQKLSPHK